MIGTPNIKAYEQTICDLLITTVLDLMGMDENSVMVIHGGGLYKDKEATLKRWCKQYLKLPDVIKNVLYSKTVRDASLFKTV